METPTRVNITMDANHLKVDTATAYGIDPTDSREGCDNLVWLPKSQVSDWSINGRNLSFSLPQWLIDAKNLKQRFAVASGIQFSH